MRQIRVVDSHTGGEPTRVVVDGGPDLGDGSLVERLSRLRDRHDRFRSAVVNEPRGSDVLVGALLVPPSDPACAAGVIFFNNVGYLGMCGHGTIGLAVTLAHLGRIAPGSHRVETSVGTVSVDLHGDGRVTVGNVASYRWAARVTVEVPHHGPLTGDVAWGGNWFFIAPAPAGLQLALSRADALTDFAWRVRHALAAAGVTGADGAEIDHVELVAPSPTAGVDARGFVLCPGRAYDRSPCGTGTSAKLACLHADGKLRPGEVWRQESILGSVFEGRFSLDEEGRVLPQITGAAHVTAEATLLLDERDPLCWGVREGVWPGGS
jgi:4-hydroxyproline epimerase